MLCNFYTTGYIAKGDTKNDFIYITDKWHVSDGWYINIDTDIPDVMDFDPDDVEYIELIDVDTDDRQRISDEETIGDYMQAVAYSANNAQERPDGAKLIEGRYFITAKYKGFDTGICYLGEYGKTDGKYGFTSYFRSDGIDSLEEMKARREKYLSADAG